MVLILLVSIPLLFLIAYLGWKFIPDSMITFEGTETSAGKKIDEKNFLVKGGIYLYDDPDNVFIGDINISIPRKGDVVFSVTTKANSYPFSVPRKALEGLTRGNEYQGDSYSLKKKDDMIVLNAEKTSRNPIINCSVKIVYIEAIVARLQKKYKDSAADDQLRKTLGKEVNDSI